MTYDFHGSWGSNAGHNSPLYQSPPGDPDGSVETGINYLVNTRGLPETQREKWDSFLGKKYNHLRSMDLFPVLLLYAF
ncbi:hypothetical protein Ct9H90mP12_1170 [bacterium]|nr:MAG: hypothetical protein Ct9H90mP12_1170 [bacterium]